MSTAVDDITSRGTEGEPSELEIRSPLADFQPFLETCDFNGALVVQAAENLRRSEPHLLSYFIAAAVSFWIDNKRSPEETLVLLSSLAPDDSQRDTLLYYLAKKVCLPQGDLATTVTIVGLIKAPQSKQLLGSAIREKDPTYQVISGSALAYVIGLGGGRDKRDAAQLAFDLQEIEKATAQRIETLLLPDTKALLDE